MSTKQLGVVIVTCLWSVGLFGGLGYTLNQSAYSVPLLVTIGIAAIVEAALLALCLGLVTDYVGSLLIFLVPALAVFIGGGLSISAGAGAILLLLIMWSAYRSLKWEMNNRLHLQIWPMFSPSARLVTLGILLGGIGLAYPWLLKQIEGGAVHLRSDTVAPFLKYIPGYNGDMTIDQWIRSQVDSPAAQLAGETPLQPNNDQQTAALNQLQQRFGQNVSGQSTLSALVASTINQQLTTFTQKFPVIVTLLVIVVIFLTLRTLTPFLVIPVLVLLVALVWIGRQVGMVTLTEEACTVEKLTL